LTISERLPLAVVFLISRRCNLQCSYCNVEAGPQAKGALEPHTFESWIGTFGELGDVDLGIQLHGGEPLLLDPSVELLASIARNAVVPYSSSAVGKISIVTNGTLLDADRARSLVDAGLHVVVSVDGPQHVHDRHRVTGSGRGTHQQAMRGVDALRSAGADPAVIAVISEPSDVANVLRFFISIGLSRVKINPVRPEGRGTTIRGADDAAHMLALADAYFNAAKMLAAHNQHAQQPTYEENIALLLARAIGGGDPQNGVASWTLLLDDRGRLWSHPGGYGVEHMALTEGETPSPELLSRVLGITGEDRMAHVTARQRATFMCCAGCIDPMWCTRFRPLVGGPSVSADCVWRDRLTNRLQAWWRESPSDAIRVLPSRVDEIWPKSSPTSLQKSPAENAMNANVLQFDGPAEPAVRSILDAIRVTPEGNRYIENLAGRVTEICRLDPRMNATTFLQLATLARDYAVHTDHAAVAQCLARLARVGLEPLVRHGASL
jgi:molybdenum cofactor biosynthesis enzyme MoaA